MCNYATVCGGKREFKIGVIYSYYMWKFLDRNSAVIFLVPLMFLDFSYALLLMRVHPNHLKTMSWISSLIGSIFPFCIHTRVLELSAKSRMCVHGTNFLW